MCGFIISEKNIENLDQVNRLIQLRGPDLVTQKQTEGFTFVHSLLSITGALTPQPFESDGICCVYNGEIYNHAEFGTFESDGQCLITAYKKYGPTFTRHLDGEFALALVDRSKNICIFSSDTFKTKPLFYSVSEQGLAAASYSDPLVQLGYADIQKMPPNTTLVIDLTTRQILEKHEVTSFDIDHQHKTSFDDWITSFENAIAKRTDGIREKLFIGLSSGYDSGAICCALMRNKTPFKAYLVCGTEHEGTLIERLKLMVPAGVQIQLLSKTDEPLAHSIAYIKSNTEEFKYTISSSSSDYNEFWLSLTDDGGSRYLSYICQCAKTDGYKILLSGMGPDEIFSDYGFNGVKAAKHSNFGGLFPADLRTIFPWNSFFGSSMESYIAKEEYVGGAFGIEVRYPFLDREVVQEFLWLHHDLKNSLYKAPVDAYLSKYNFPFNKNVKMGF